MKNSSFAGKRYKQDSVCRSGVQYTWTYIVEKTIRSKSVHTACYLCKPCWLAVDVGENQELREGEQELARRTPEQTWQFTMLRHRMSQFINCFTHADLSGST